ncbi:apolipoprotein L3-like [Mixophyes fleayi]|uniref:apolipoprotein L3-like n=1 Tax=Mixophyes fleayi TaxID=3061075 RepID=UPI003F4D8AEC
MADKAEKLLQSPDTAKKLHKSIMTRIQKYKDTRASLIKEIEKCSKKLLCIADDIDKFHKGATIASVTGSSVGIAGGITSIVGLALAPFTFGASLIVSIVGISVAVAGGVTGAAASIADTVNIKKKCNRVEKKVMKIEEKCTKIHNICENITIECEALKSLLENMGKIGGRGVFMAVEISRLAQLGRISAAATRGVELVAQGARAARVVSGVFAAVFIVVDAAFVVKGAIDLHKGAKTEAAAEIRKIVHDLREKHDELQKQDKELQLILQDLEAENHK